MTNLENFQVIRDGEPDKEWLLRQKRVEAVQTVRTIGHGTLELLAAATAPIASKMAEVALNVEMDMHDYKHGTHVRQEYFQHKRELATAALRGEIGL